MIGRIVSAAIFLLPVFVFAEITRQPDGLLKVDELRFGLVHWDNEWGYVSQQNTPGCVAFPGEAAVKTERGDRRDGIFRTKESGEFALSEFTRRISADELRLRYELSSANGIPTKLAGFGGSMPVSSFRAGECTWNGKPLPAVPQTGTILKGEKANMLRIPMSGGVLEVTGAFSLRFDYPKSDKGSVGFLLLFPESYATIRKSALEVGMKYTPFQTALLDLRLHMNMGFRDEVANDGKGGWTDQGSENDLRAMKPGEVNFAGIRFSIVDPGTNRGKSCLAFRGKERPNFLEKAEYELPQKPKGKYLYLVNGVAWAPTSGTNCGFVDLQYEDGSAETRELKAGVDTGNFWSPRNLENAYVGWENVNGSSRIGLYVSRIPLQDKALTRLTLRSADQVWMVLAATVGSATMSPQTAFAQLTVKADQTWMPFTDSQTIEPGSILDFSGLLDAPAGKHGFVRAVGENFEFEKRPGKAARFWGTNLCLEAQFAPNELLDRLLDQLAAEGVTILRIHHFDRYLAAADTPPGVLNPERLERLDYLLAEAAKRGIYLTLDFYTLRTLPEIKGNTETKLRFYFDPAARKNFLDFASALMDHQNPYSGLKWKDDPAVAFITLVNESTISFLIRRASPELKEKAEALFVQHAAQEKWEVTPENRERQFERFLNFTGASVYAEMSAALRKAGVRTPFSDQSFHQNPSVTRTRSHYDYVDTHFYWIHPTYLGKNPWSTPYSVAAGSSIPSLAGGMNEMFRNRLTGKPFTITEWNYCYPNQYAAEGPFLVGAYGALQNYSGMTQFAYAHDVRVLENKMPLGPFDYGHNPVVRLGMRAGSLFFLRGDIAPSPISVPFYQPEEYWQLPRFIQTEVTKPLGLIVRTGTAFDAKCPDIQGLIYSRGTPPPAGKVPAVLAGSDKNTLEELARQGVIPADCFDFAKGTFKSSTGELLLDKNAGIFQAISKRSEAFILPEGKTGTGPFARVNNRKSFGAFLVAAADDRPLTESRRILILHLTDVKNDGAVFREPEMATLEKSGSPALLLRRGEAELLLPESFAGKLFACDITGRRRFEIQPEKPGLYRLKTDSAQGPILTYELIREM